ncbi:MAG: TonB family protein [Chitinophagaceae bacterium]
MQANLLDILFENRNKEYGAYALRQGYNKRMLVALGAGMAVILLFMLISRIDKKEKTVIIKKDNSGIVIKEYVLPQEKPKEPVKPKEVAKIKPKAPAQATPKVAEIKFTTPDIKETVKTPMPPADAIATKTPSDKNVAGTPDAGVVKLPVVPQDGNGTGDKAGPSGPAEQDFIIQERDPEFPGGEAGLQKFLTRYLTTPDRLEAGDKKVVKVKFKVDKDGSVNTFEILTSGGGEFDAEVVRVCKKMPRWIPAIQNGMNVPVSYVLPVTFIGLEE